MKFNKYIALYCLGLILVKCDTVPEFELVEQDPKLNLSFVMKSGDQQIDIGDEFLDEQGYNLVLKTCRFYISDLEIVGTKGAQGLSEVELFNFNEAQDGQQNPFVQNYNYIIKKDEFSEIRFAVGLAPDLNTTDPTILDKDDPLGANSNMYWDWGAKYIFVMLEAGIDIDVDGVFDDDIGFHTGLDEQYFGPQDLNISLALDAFDKESLTIAIDWNLLFPESGPNSIDLSAAPFVHANSTEEARDLSRRFMNNFISSLKVE